MKGKTWLFWGGLIATAGGVLFQTSYEVQELEEKLASVNRRIVAEQESIQVLKAEWSFLNEPTRLETLARSHMALQPVEARQFASLDIIPMRPAPAVAPEPALPPALLPPPAGVPMVRAPQGGPAQQPAVAGLPNAPRPAAAPNAAPNAAAVAAARAADPAGKPAIIPAAATPAKPAPIKPSALVPATAKAPAPPAAERRQETAPAGKLPANAPLPSLNRPTDVAAMPPKPAATQTAGTQTAGTQTAYVPKPTDSLGLLVARLGANR
ncbi:cell division protein FtsL [Azospirillum thermophilum]|uniref:Uncharacterized protein n=1 Tax=Azospirillum thermophilum TaxID=2202148 RepID=A0A2S2CSR4_9PROT|nr:hypothetical protein [Azospirillum thermophilum]AWK87509.1 hypothetical protein DEW08_15935 [Azospirillum thermophilum]